MGTIASALTRSRNTVVQLSSEPGAPQAAPSKPRFFRSRGKGAGKAAAEPRRLPPGPGAWERSGRRGRRRRQREDEEDGRHEELSVVLKRPGEEQGTAGLALPLINPRRSRSACECDAPPLLRSETRRRLLLLKRFSSLWRAPTQAGAGISVFRYPTESLEGSLTDLPPYV